MGSALPEHAGQRPASRAAQGGGAGPTCGHARRRDAHRLVGDCSHGAFEQLDVSLMLPRHVRVFKEDRALAAAFQHPVSNMCMAGNLAWRSWQLSSLFFTGDAYSDNQTID